MVSQLDSCQKVRCPSKRDEAGAAQDRKLKRKGVERRCASVSHGIQARGRTAVRRRNEEELEHRLSSSMHGAKHGTRRGYKTTFLQLKAS